MGKKCFWILITFLFSAQIGFAQSNSEKIVKTSFKVQGVCGMCKKRIEEAAYIKGVKFAEWNVKTGELKLVYRSDKTSEEQIHKSIAAAGHSTEKLQGDSIAYKKLPACCAYETVEKH